MFTVYININIKNSRNMNISKTYISTIFATYHIHREVFADSLKDFTAEDRLKVAQYYEGKS
jgi:hypothetical protein